tara:strand:- start:522 stop:671 length:150 start_codon:yes stop_codon:yes gene_type:complete
MIEWVLAILWYMCVGIVAVGLVLFTSLIGACFHTAFVWNEFMKPDEKGK